MKQRQLEIASRFAVSGEYGLQGLHDLGWFVHNNGVRGDFVECGVARGGTAAALGSAITAMKYGRRLWLFDSFEGLPSPSQEDGPFARGQTGHFQGSQEEVLEVLSNVGVDPNRVSIIAGWFERTLTPQSDLPQEVALLHVDADLYQSVLLVLQRLYDKVAPGGVIVLDDFGWYEGTRQAFYDFVEQRRIRPLVERFGKDKLFWVKDREHNREDEPGIPVTALDPLATSD